MSAASAPPRDSAAARWRDLVRRRDSAAARRGDLARRRDFTAPFHRGPTRRTP